MKLSIKYLLILSAITLAQSVVVLADEACCDGNADTNAEAKVEEAIESSSTSEGDAGKECAADDNDCTPAVEETVVVTEEEEDPKCPSRPHIIKCAAKYLDTNNNNLLERSELDAAMGEVHWLARGLLKVIGSTDAIMKKCDADGDGAISVEADMEATKETCLATCFKRNAFKKLFFPDCTE